MSERECQAMGVKIDGRIPIANSVQDEDYFWAVCDGGGSQYGVVTEFVLEKIPAARNFPKERIYFYSARK